MMKIEEVRAAIANGTQISYTTHCQERMIERNISRQDVSNAIMFGEIIEDYPLKEDNTSLESLPACLILWVDVEKNGAIHVVIGYNGIRILVVTAYKPDEKHRYVQQ